MFLIDSHCHLNQLDYKNVHKNISDVLKKAHQQGVQLVLSVSTDLIEYKNMTQIIGCRKDVLFSCGIHPVNICKMKEGYDIKKLCDLSSERNVVAIGETGLDYYHYSDHKNIQKQAFKEHIDLANRINKPLIVHSRNAINDVIILLREGKADKCGGVLHCFNEDVNIARILLDMNFYLSFSGMITFSKFYALKQVIKYVPVNRLLLETDSPYLTPEPYRGQENQPAYLYEIAKYVANIKNITLDHVACVTTSNFYTLFHVI